jgi:L-ascorbate metabolism protein UlaG (beta-lactamase superfamily)
MPVVTTWPSLAQVAREDNFAAQSSNKLRIPTINRLNLRETEQLLPVYSEVGTPICGSRMMQLRWLGTAGFELRSDGGTILLIDPYLSRPPSARPQSPPGLTDIPHADAILVTHGHFDHAFDVPALAQWLGAPVYAASSVCQTLVRHGAPRPGQPANAWPSEGTAPSMRAAPTARTLPPATIVPLTRTLLHPIAPGDSVQVGDLRIHALAARHVRFDLPLALETLPHLLPSMWSLRPLLSGWPAGQVLGFHVTAPELSLVHFGSAGWVKGALESLRPDVALIPVQGRSDIAQIAARMAALLQPRLVVPHHWDDFCPPISRLISLASFARALSHPLPGTQLHVPQIGETWQVAWSDG